MAYIYGLRCECGCEKNWIRYVGQTISPLNTRLTNHRGQARFGTKTPVYNWIRKHGPENIRIELLEETTRDDIDDREVWWIANTPNLLNLASGGTIGDSNRGRKRPDISAIMTGSAHFRTSLTEGDVEDIRSSYRGGRGEVTLLAKKYGMSQAGMSDILRGNTWQHVPGASAAQGKKRIRLNPDDVRAIRSRRENGETLASIARDYDTSETNIMYICERRTWKNVE